MFLYLDTTSECTTIMLFDKNGIFFDSKKWQSQRNQSEELLLKINSILLKNNFDKSKLKGIIVNTGPGSYTGLRVGLSTANTLAFSLNIPIFSANENEINISIKKLLKLSNKNFKSTVMPVYGHPAKITLKKPRP
jgi:tRNA threonylcarbamoyladenosine biosynthesis protein TsaB